MLNWTLGFTLRLLLLWERFRGKKGSIGINRWKRWPC